MVAFSFKSRFVLPIELGTKQQTIRNVRKRNARPGDGLQLMTGPRFQPRRIGTADCLAAGPIQIRLGASPSVHVEAIDGSGRLEPRFIFGHRDLDAFAVRDGFDEWPDLEAFWRETHDTSAPWAGRWTFWGETFKGPLDR